MDDDRMLRREDAERRTKQWLQLISDDDSTGGDTFAERAESYYRKRPQLHSLLHDLYNSYITLLERYNRRCNGQVLFAVEEENTGSDSVSSVTDPRIEEDEPLDADEIIAQVVIKEVEKELLLSEMEEADEKARENDRRITLMEKLIEVLETERIVLLNENVTLGFKMTSLLEENKGLLCESMFLKKKVGDLAKCVMKMREDYRIGVVVRKIEDLQEQINALEKMNDGGAREGVTWRKSPAAVVVEDVKKTSPGGRNGKSRLWCRLVKGLDLAMCGFRHECSF